jgi:hypothetical protein
MTNIDQNFIDQIFETVRKEFKQPRRKGEGEYKINFHWQNATDKLGKLDSIIEEALFGASSLYWHKQENWHKQEIIEAIDAVRHRLPIANLLRLEDASNRSSVIKYKLQHMSIEELEALLDINN